MLRMGPGAAYGGPELATGGGQMFIVFQGTLRYDGDALAARSAVALTRDEKALTFRACDSGAQVPVFQYPRRDSRPASWASTP